MIVELNLLYRYLGSAMSYLLTCLQRKDKDRQLALVTIGYLAVFVEDDIAKYLPQILEFIRATLPVKVSIRSGFSCRNADGKSSSSRFDSISHHVDSIPNRFDSISNRLDSISNYFEFI